MFVACRNRRMRGPGMSSGAGRPYSAIEFSIQITVFLGLLRRGYTRIGRLVKCKEALLTSHGVRPRYYI